MQFVTQVRATGSPVEPVLRRFLHEADHRCGVSGDAFPVYHMHSTLPFHSIPLLVKPYDVILQSQQTILRASDGTLANFNSLDIFVEGASC